MTKVLIVEDDPDVRSFLSFFLQRKGYDVVLAQDGQKGFESFVQERPNVIVLDLQLPGIDGLTVLRQVRSLNPLQPVIVLTGGTDEQTEQQVHALGVTELVEKESAVYLLEPALKRMLVQSLSPISAIAEGPYCESPLGDVVVPISLGDE